MKKRIIMFLTIFLVLFPISVSASKVESNGDTDEKYKLNSINVKCQKETRPQTGSKCSFKASGGADVYKLEILLYSDSEMKNKVGGFAEKGSSFDYNQSFGNPIDKLKREKGQSFTYYVKALTYRSSGDKWVYSYHYKMTYSISSSDSYTSKIKLDSIWKKDESAAFIIEDKNMENLSPTSGASPSEIMKSKCDDTLKTLIKKYWKWIIFLAPILLIVMITMDFLKAMTSGDADAIKKSSTNAFKRAIAAIILIMLPWALDVVFDWFGLQICF